MAKIQKKDLKQLRLELITFLDNSEEIFNLTNFVNLLNTYLPINEQIYTKRTLTERAPKILLCTGAGNVVQGGSDVWVNNFLKEVWPRLKNKRSYKLLIDSKRPSQFKESSLPEGLDYHFHFDDPDKTESWLKESKEIISLHSHYHERPYIWKYEDRFSKIFVHAYPRDMESVLTEIKDLERDRVQYNTRVDVDWCDDYFLTYNKRIWIGLNRSEVLKKFPVNTITIPNYYTFKQNIPLSKKIKPHIGFAARGESRKCMHWLNNHKGFALTSQFDFKNLKDTTSYTMKGIELYQWDISILHNFMLKDFTIFHGCYHKEPFGYSIFQAVDYGKLPIIHTDWGVGLNYRYRASTKNEFDKCVKKMLSDSYETRLKEFNKIKDWMQQFSDSKKWTDQVLKIIQ